MSDVEQKWLQTAPSVCSDQESEPGPGTRSLSSIDLVHQRRKHSRPAMSDHSDLQGLGPGQQKPPHHQAHLPQDDPRPPTAPARRAKPTHQWSFDASGSQSGETGSPRKESDDIPSISVASKGKAPKSETDRLYEEMFKQMGDETPLTQKTKRPKSKKSRKDKRGTLAEMPMQDLNSTDSQLDSFVQPSPVRERKSRRESKKQRAEASSAPSASDSKYENPAFEHEGTDPAVGPSQQSSETQQASIPTSKKTRRKETTFDPVTSGELEPATEEQLENNGDGGRNASRNWMSGQISQGSCHTLHTANLPSHNLSADARRNFDQTHTAMYICNNISQRECCCYARDKGSPKNDCQCGRDIQWHRDKGLQIDMQSEHQVWHPKTHTELMPCDSFGEILFRGFGSQSKNSPYLRVDSACEMDKVWTVLTDCWQLPVPKLLISVTGGAKRFSLRPRLKSILKQGLVNAAVSTGAWIITGGTATGVMEFVGEAVQDHIQSLGNELNECVALGIASWGSVANNLALDGEGEQGQFPAMYCMEDIDSTRRGIAPLDHNHTHFLLVDDGSHAKFGVEISFRSKLESYISQKVETGVAETQSVNVPTVLIVVEGGINTMKTVRESITRNIPVVVIDRSGRAADFIATAFRITRSANSEDQTLYPADFDKTMMKHGRILFEWKRGMSREDVDRNIHEAIHYLKDCLEERKLLNIFNLDRADSVKDIDRAILYALLRANKSNANSQLALALAWNRCDIARQEIFTAENRHNWHQEDLYNAMFTALVQNRADFVQLFLDNGVDLKRFLTTPTLWNLYCNCIIDQTSPEANLLRFLITYLKQSWTAFLLCRGTPDFENFPDLLPHINKVIVHLLQDQSYRFYSDDKHKVMNESPSMTWKGDAKTIKPMKERIESRKSLTDQGTITRRRARHKFHDEVEFEHPERELFIWAVLFNRRELVQLFWRSGRDHLGGALFASALLYRLSNVADDEEEAELSRDMLNHSDVCERLAVSVISECYSRDKPMSHKLLIREQCHWGKTTLFKMAESYELMEFAEQSACQTKLSSIWKGRMALYTSEMKIFLSTFLPILVPFIKFTLDPKEKEKEEEMMADQNDLGRPDTPGRNKVAPNMLPDDDKDGKGFIRARTRRKAHSHVTKLKKVNLFDFTTDNINILSAIYYFYQAPVTKFFCNIISYVLFTGLFSYVVLVKLAPTDSEDSPGVTEYLVWGWLVTMIMEEFRQLFIRDQQSLKYKFRSWYSNVWNRFDAAMYLLFVLSIVLRYQLTASNFVWARVTYSITLAMFFLRFMQFFYVEKNMGPKVIMIRKMLTDLMFFFLILLVFMVSFGVAYHANMFPQSPPSWSVLANVLYFPYFQMYGELFLENMKGEQVDDCTTNETIWRDDPFKRCPEENIVVPILLALYMVLTNILLVNLLIAMFSYTFQTVQDNSLQVWRFYRLSLIFEYFDRPTLVPPLIIINHMFRLGCFFTQRLTGKCKRYNSFRCKLSTEEQNRLTLFERSAMEHHLSMSKQQSMLTLDSRVKNTAKRLDSVMEELQMIKESIQQQESGRTALPAGPGPNLASSMDMATLQKERELMERAPVKRERNDSETTTPAAAAIGAASTQDVDALQRTVASVVAQNSDMSQRMSQLTAMLEQSMADQRSLLDFHQQHQQHLQHRRAQLRAATQLDVQDVDDAADDASQA